LNVGIIGIYLARIHKSLQGRPPYIISEEHPNEQNKGADHD